MKGLAPLREIGVEVIPLGARQRLPRPIAAGGRRRSSRRVADKHWNLLAAAPSPALLVQTLGEGIPTIRGWAHRGEGEAPLGWRR